jgi:hypothetical protein
MHDETGLLQAGEEFIQVYFTADWGEYGYGRDLI